MTESVLDWKRREREREREEMEEGIREFEEYFAVVVKR